MFRYKPKEIVINSNVSHEEVGTSYLSLKFLRMKHRKVSINFISILSCVLPGFLSFCSTINWNAEPENALTFPLGLGYTRTVFIGKTRVKMRLEPQYTVFRPEDYGNVWNIRFQFAPVIKSPFIEN